MTTLRGSSSPKENDNDITLRTNAMLYDDYNLHNFKHPSLISGSKDIRIQLPPPRVGQHRPNVDAVFCVARGYSVEVLARFVGSLLETGFTGDIVLAVMPFRNTSRRNQQIREFLQYHAEHHNVVAYEMDLECARKGWRHCKSINFFKNVVTNEYVADVREHRDVSQLRYEYYWAWSQFYGRNTRIFVTDGRDVYFQHNPFDFLSSSGDSMDQTLVGIVEDPEIIIETEVANNGWILHAAGGEGKGERILHQIQKKSPLCSGTTLGGKMAMESYLRAMIQSYDENPCTLKGCDQGYHQILFYTGRLQQSPDIGPIILPPKEGDVPAILSLAASPRIQNIEYFAQGSSFVSTLAMYCIYHQPLRAFGLLDNTTNMVLNWDKSSLVAVVHQFDRCPELNAIMEERGKELLQKFHDRKAQRQQAKHPQLAQVR
ncbi:MAG: hypothetical protein SGILL_000342, partial [Bacillariaceae sp.]